MPRVYRAYNGPMPTTAAFATVTTGTAIKTMLQIAPPSTAVGMDITEWGVFIESDPTLIKVELIETDVAATVTAHIAAGLVKISNPGDLASVMTLGTAATGYTATAEGTITATRLLDMTTLRNGMGKEWHQYPLDREPNMAASKFYRIRVTATAAVNMGCYIEWAEG
jgi:hypothetical protein